MKVNKTTFINLLKNEAIKGWGEYSVLPSLTIAQAILETGWGKSSIGNNLFGIKANSKWTGKKKLVKTHEYVDGKKIYIDAWFRDYDTIYESLEDRYRFLQANRYKKIIGEKDYKVACVEILKAGYATDPNYSKLLISIIEQNKLYELDNIAIDKFKPLKSPPTTSIVPETASSWATEAWSWATKKGFVDGNRPRDGLTREEFATIISRMVN